MENLLRRVPPSFFPDGKPKEKPLFTAFRPRAVKRTSEVTYLGDWTGLSVNREWFTTVDHVAKHPDRDEIQGVVRLSMTGVWSLGLSAIEDPLDDDCSHALIPEINSRDYNGDRKGQIKEILNRLANEVAEVVKQPPSDAPPSISFSP